MCTSVCIDLCRSQSGSSKFRDAGLISCGSGWRLQFLHHFPAGSPSSPLMDLPRVDASCVRCQKVKVPGTLQNFCRFQAYSDPSVPFSTGRAGSVGERALRYFLCGNWGGKSSLKTSRKKKDNIFIVSASAFM